MDAWGPEMEKGDPCKDHWPHTMCGGPDGMRIIAVFLGEFGLEGTIDPAVTEMEYLQTFQMHNNSLTGPMPPGFGNLTRLMFLWLQHNDLTGVLPEEYYASPDMLELRLNHNPALCGDYDEDRFVCKYREGPGDPCVLVVVNGTSLGGFLQVPDLFTKNNFAYFEFSTPGALYHTCQRDHHPIERCSGPSTANYTSLGDGEHHLVVSAVFEEEAGLMDLYEYIPVNYTWKIDAMNPVVIMDVPETARETFTVDILVDEQTQSKLTIEDCSITGGHVTNLQEVQAMGDGTTYRVAIIADASEYRVDVAILANRILDLAGNPNAATPLYHVAIDRFNPELRTATGLAVDTRRPLLQVDMLFSESVVIAPTSFELTGAIMVDKSFQSSSLYATAKFVCDISDDTQRTRCPDAEPDHFCVEMRIAAGAFVDIVGNPSLKEYVYTFDMTVPGLEEEESEKKDTTVVDVLLGLIIGVIAVAAIAAMVWNHKRKQAMVTPTHEQAELINSPLAKTNSFGGAIVAAILPKSMSSKSMESTPAEEEGQQLVTV
ncbi:hypothetical protein CYMTET_26211 [Cymbomonas tetramitiformis]|uniref:Uncharacterized protein n=1 Tax=Cymbomonas tetramitiformis TaxID=36881 RepID=A0AAE0FS83_9CHLO|nr:hypothetical protein CYMTET_26211 [Cymbomonas tetramitiformis]